MQAGPTCFLDAADEAKNAAEAGVEDERSQEGGKDKLPWSIGRQLLVYPSCFVFQVWLIPGPVWTQGMAELHLKLMELRLDSLHDRVAACRQI